MATHLDNHFSDSGPHVTAPEPDSGHVSTRDLLLDSVFCARVKRRNSSVTTRVAPGHTWFLKVTRGERS
jgi:hypothetical protein